MNAIPAFCGSALLLVAAASNAGSLRAEHYKNAGATSKSAADRLAITGRRCTSVSDSVATRWHSLHEWRRLAPYPVQRDATPTDSVGVWIERWSMEARTELRRVSARRTIVLQLDENSCEQKVMTYDRHYNADSLAHAFTDASLDTLLREHARGMLYIWSPRMPLSVRGLREAKAAAASLGIAFTAVVAEANAEDLTVLRALPADTRPMESIELVYRNATIHYPSVLFYNNHKVVDGVIPGYKNRDTYALLGRQWLNAEHSAVALAVEAADATVTAPAPNFWVDRNAKVTTRSSIPTVRRIGFFFKPIAGTTLISYTSVAQDAAYLFDIRTGKEQNIPGHVDPVPTPDGRFLLLPGLQFLGLRNVVAGSSDVLFTDKELPDEYQTASILHENRASLRYRVVTGWRAGARFRDYDVKLDKHGQPATISAVDVPFIPCGTRLLTLPISAKSGHEIGAFDAKAKSDFIIEVTPQKTCVDKFNLGFATGKMSFSYDGSAIAFSTARINTDLAGELIRPSESFFKDALVLYRKTGRIVSLSQNRPLLGMTFPEFQKDGTVMLLDQISAGRLVEVIRVVTVK